MFDFTVLPSGVLQRMQWRIGDMISSRPASFLRCALQVPGDALAAIFNLTIAN